MPGGKHLALGHIGLYRFPIEKNLVMEPKKNTKIYPNIYKYIQDTQDIYKIPGGGQAAGPEPHGPISCISCIYLYIHVFGYIWIYVGYIFGDVTFFSTYWKSAQR